MGLFRKYGSIQFCTILAIVYAAFLLKLPILETCHWLSHQVSADAHHHFLLGSDEVGHANDSHSHPVLSLLDEMSDTQSVPFGQDKYQTSSKDVKDHTSSSVLPFLSTLNFWSNRWLPKKDLCKGQGTFGPLVAPSSSELTSPLLAHRTHEI